VVLNVPFSTQEGAKPRPAVVVSADAFHRNLPDIIVCPVSSQPRFYQRPGPGDCPLRKWRTVGLRYPSTVRVSNILAVDKQLIRRALGSLAAEDRERLVDALRRALDL
jgi:mRNA-degrading endonuclease toxin of MazEF toxin-antitoxin module